MLLIHLLNLLFYKPLEFIITITIIIVPLFMSITIHEWAHGYVAYKFGDPTPKLQGRLTLNPFAHLDPMGTLMLFIIGIGWAKPVMLNPKNYPTKTKQMLVSLAGPASNFLLAIILGFILVTIQILTHGKTNEIFETLIVAISIIIRINLLLAIFNMIPIPPLDGSKIITWILPEKLEYSFSRFEPYGLFLILLIFFMGGFTFLLKSTDFIEIKLLESIKIFILTIIR